MAILWAFLVIFWPTNFTSFTKLSIRQSFWLYYDWVIHFILEKKNQDKSLKNLPLQLTLSGADLDCSFRTMLLTQCTVCNVTLFWHHLDILLSSSTHQIRHIYRVKCLIMFLLPRSIYYLVAPQLWNLMLFK